MRKLPAGIVALSGFFVFGAVMSGLTCVALLYPGGWLEPMWRLNPEAHKGFLLMGAWAILLMLAVSIACALSAYGLFHQATWGYRLSITVLAVNLAGDVTAAIVRHDMRTLIGI